MKTAFEIVEDEFINKHSNIGQAIQAAIAVGYTDDEAKNAVKEFANKYVSPFDGWVD